MINEERLARTFASLVEIDSVSWKEGQIAETLKNIMEELGAATLFDQAGEKINGESGNLIAKFAGTTKAPTLLLNAHMDTVQPGEGIKVVFENGIFKSDGTTILGADDKSAVAVIIEILRVIKENDISHGPLEVVFTVCEEVGLQGAKNLDYSLLTAKFGYALDATDTEGIIVRAPAANRLEFEVIGKDAHAGAAPEKGINAISLAGKAIADLELGRIDEETSCNIGIIEGGIATNIVPRQVIVKGEVRSHNLEKLEKLTDEIVSSFKNVVQEARRESKTNGLPDLNVKVINDFPRTDLPKDHPVVRLARTAAENLGRKMRTKVTGGGADANIFFGKGIMTGVLGTGMREMHSVREYVSIEDMIKTAELVVEIIKLNAAG
jgi:tripeptide aminopeptidase